MRRGPPALLLALLAQRGLGAGCRGKLLVTTGARSGAHAHRCAGVYDVGGNEAGRKLYVQERTPAQQTTSRQAGDAPGVQPCTVYYFEHLRMWVLGVHVGRAPVFAWAHSRADSPAAVGKEWSWFERMSGVMHMLPELQVRRCEASGARFAPVEVATRAPTTALRRGVSASIQLLGFGSGHFHGEMRSAFVQALVLAAALDPSTLGSRQLGISARIDAIATIYFNGVKGEAELPPEDWAALGVNATCTLFGADVNRGTAQLLRTDVFRKRFVAQLRLHDIEAAMQGGAMIVTAVRPFGALPAAPWGWQPPRAQTADHLRRRHSMKQGKVDDDGVAAGGKHRTDEELARLIAKVQEDEPMLLVSGLRVLALAVLAALVAYLTRYCCHSPERVAPRNVRMSPRNVQHMHARGHSLRHGAKQRSDGSDGGSEGRHGPGAAMHLSLPSQQKSSAKKKGSSSSSRHRTAPSGAEAGAHELLDLPSV
jgi:hypothetical protein